MLLKVVELPKGRRRLAVLLLLAAVIGLVLGTRAVVGHLHRRKARQDRPAEPDGLAEVVALLTSLAPPLVPPAAFSPAGSLPPESHRRAARRIDYTQEIRPILSGACFGCHGPNSKARQAGLRLDTRAHAVKSAIVPGDAARSPLLQKVCSPSKATLTAGQIDLLRRWIDQGAIYQDHWAFVPPVRPPVPAVHDPRWARNAIDAFVAAGHEKQGLSPTPEADRRTLLRRLSYDLTGLPPSPDDVEAFLHAPPEAYEQWVDRLLASPHFGERMAVLWLDLVRYADTDGYSVDAPRSIWPYRDWVINAFNRNLPFDQFTTRQLAGDLLPAASSQDRIASGYNRLLMTSSEMCANEQERRAQYLADRVRNVSSAWLGLTMGCAECHDHKFDPLTARNFYRLGAFFADVREKGVGTQEISLLLDPVRDALLVWHDALIRRLEDRLLELPGLDQAVQEMEARAAGPRDPGRELPPEVLAAAATPGADRTPDQVRVLLWHFQPDLPGLKPTLMALLLTGLSRHALVEKGPFGTLTTVSGPRRVVRVLPRGNVRDRSGEVVGPGLPEVLSGGYPLGESPTRLDLAKWLVAEDNPLTARVFVNHLWRIAFGKGLVATPEDFGTRGSPPSHPALLDWLAVEFRESGWDVKALLRLLVTSRSYRQASLVPPGQRQRDPKNVWLARQETFRLDAEFVRDNALAAAGLLARRIRGPGVAPYQPDGYWIERTYLPSANDDQHRRGLYTLWCRNYLHPALQLFDAPSRRVCCAERSRSATPLQSLELLNDPSFTEAARALACRVLREAPPESRLAHAFRLALAREPVPAESRVLGALYQHHLDGFRRDHARALALTSVGQMSPAPDLDVAEWAAWTSVMRAILNLHETVTRY